MRGSASDGHRPVRAAHPRRVEAVVGGGERGKAVRTGKDPRTYRPKRASSAPAISLHDDRQAARRLLAESTFTTRQLRRGWAYDADEVDVALKKLSMHWTPFAQKARGASFSSRRARGFDGYACEEVDAFLDGLLDELDREGEEVGNGHDAGLSAESGQEMADP